MPHNVHSLAVLNRQDLAESPIERLTAMLTCFGAQASAVDQEYVRSIQNPYAQKRGSLGFGAFSRISVPGSGTRFANVNIFAAKQASVSTLRLVFTDRAAGVYSIIGSGDIELGTGQLVPTPRWGSRQLSSGRAVLEVIQQHGLKAHATVIGSSRCPLFDRKQECSFCMLDGGGSNTQRSITELCEAAGIISQQRLLDDQGSWALTLSTVLVSLDEAWGFVPAIQRIKSAMGRDNALALEMNPLVGDVIPLFQALKNVGLDTLMLPLDCATTEAQQLHVPGKSSLLSDTYWKNVRAAVPLFGAGNVTSNIIVGLEPLADTFRVLQQMIDDGVVGEAIPVRWDDSKSFPAADRPLTRPEDMLAVRRFIRSRMAPTACSTHFAPTKAGCAACGGCGGVAH